MSLLNHILYWCMACLCFYCECISWSTVSQQHWFVSFCAFKSSLHISTPRLFQPSALKLPALLFNQAHITDDMLLGVLKTYPARKLLSNNAQLRKMSCLGPGYARMHIFLWFYHLLAPVAASDQYWKWKWRGIIPVNPSAWELHDANIMAEGLA